TVVHQRRLWADVRERPDDHSRYVTWDPHHGSYDRALERQAWEGPPDGRADRERERRQAKATARVLEFLRDALADHDEQVQAEWYALPIDEACPDIASAAA
ncbi:MAG: HNH endonuclease signature motif containing protein, partial [Phycicoccus sp.]